MFGSSCLGRRLGLSIALVVAMASGARASGTMGLPIAQVSLTELQATQQARQQMEANAAGAAADARPQMNPDNAVPAPAGGNDATPDAGATGGGGGILKYLPAYFLIVLFTGLGIAAVGRPVRRLPPDGT
jgi:predicted carbohydrate-binding protein with CBM5 and CBM33 domain